MFTKELIERMKKKNITIEKTMKGLWEYATITLEEGRTLDTMDYDVYDGQAPNSVMFSIMIDNEAVYEDLSTDEEVLKYVLKLLNEENQTTNIKHGIVDYEEVESLYGYEMFLGDFEDEYESDIFYADGELRSCVDAIKEEDFDLEQFNFYLFDGWFVAMWK